MRFLLFFLFVSAALSSNAQTRFVSLKTQSVTGTPRERQSVDIKATEMIRVVTVYSLAVGNISRPERLVALIPELSAAHPLQVGAIIVGPARIELEAGSTEDGSRILSVAVVEITPVAPAGNPQLFSTVRAKIEASTNLVEWTEAAAVTLPKNFSPQFYRLKLSD